jgi:hypothetical protein
MIGLVRQPGWLSHKSCKMLRILRFLSGSWLNQTKTWFSLRKLKFPNNSNVFFWVSPQQPSSYQIFAGKILRRRRKSCLFHFIYTCRTYSVLRTVFTHNTLGGLERQDVSGGMRRLGGAIKKPAGFRVTQTCRSELREGT